MCVSTSRSPARAVRDPPKSTGKLHLKKRHLKNIPGLFEALEFLPDPSRSFAGPGDLTFATGATWTEEKHVCGRCVEPSKNISQWLQSSQVKVEHIPNHHL